MLVYQAPAATPPTTLTRTKDNCVPHHDIVWTRCTYTIDKGQSFVQAGSSMHLSDALRLVSHLPDTPPIQELSIC